MTWPQVFRTLVIIFVWAIIIMFGITAYLSGKGLAFVGACVGFAVIGLASARKAKNG